jgi:PDZ domain-containing secreted protein
VVRFGDIGAARAQVQAERDAGATYFILDLGRYPSEREFTEQAETFINHVAT